jgi:hypothetical protein
MSDGNASAERTLLLDAGGWDESFTGRRQDWEFGARLLKRGVRLRHSAGARGSHRLDTSFATAFRNASQEGRWDVALARKHPEIRLPFAEFARVQGGEMSRRGRFAYRLPLLARGFAHAALPVLGTLEWLNLQRQWRELSWLVLAQQYVQGVATELPSLSDLRAFVANTADEAAVASTSLDVGGPPPAAASPVAPVDVEGRCGEFRVGRVRSPEPGAQWDWDAVVARLVEQVESPPPPELLECVASRLPDGAREVLRSWRSDVA